MVLPTPDLLTQVETAARDLLPADVALAVTDPTSVESGNDGPLPQIEAAAIASARPLRQTEFIAGRRAARRAMTDLGLPPAPVPVGADRAPQWPGGVIGSLSHTRTVCLAAVAPASAARAIGIDVEDDAPLEEALIPSICTRAERARYAGPDAARLAKLTFSAKEAAYKAQYPLTKTLFGFNHLDVTFDAAKGRFDATFLAPAGAFETGDVLHGRFAQVGGHVITVVIIPHGQRDAAQTATG